jgi:hypothetical protein
LGNETSQSEGEAKQADERDDGDPSLSSADRAKEREAEMEESGEENAA